jgi:hypothetical protein
MPYRVIERRRCLPAAARLKPFAAAFGCPQGHGIVLIGSYRAGQGYRGKERVVIPL